MATGLRHGSAGLLEPFRLLFEELIDFRCGQRLIHIVLLERGNRDSQLMGNLGAGMGAFAAQGLQPLGWVVLQFAQLFVANGTILELVRRGGQLDA